MPRTKIDGRVPPRPSPIQKRTDSSYVDDYGGDADCNKGPLRAPLVPLGEESWTV
jgi:hypothetical protein